MEEANQAIFRVPGCSVLDPESFISITGAVTVFRESAISGGRKAGWPVIHFDSAKKDLARRSFESFRLDWGLTEPFNQALVLLCLRTVIDPHQNDVPVLFDITLLEFPTPKMTHEPHIIRDWREKKY